jgi:hypothetical protein
MKMKTRTSLLNLLLALATLGFMGCSTPGSFTTNPIMRTTVSDLPSIPRDLAPLGKIQITTFLDESPIVVQLPLVRGKAIKERAREGAQAFISDPLPAESVPYASGGAVAAFGGIELVGLALAPVGAAINSLRAMVKGIPAAKYYPAMRALTNAQAQFHVTKEVIHRIRSQAPPPDRSGFNFISHGAITPADTILELYEGEHSLRGNEQINPSMQFRLSFKCSLFRAIDHQLLHVFRVAYDSEYRSFVQWGANDAALFREEVETGMASMTEQIVAHLAAIEAATSRSQPPAGIQQANVR